MKPEDKELLIRDLCARLPYGVKFKHKDWDVPLVVTRIYKSAKYGTFIINERIFEDNFDEIKPYLRSMSSMTEDEVKEFYDVECIDAKVGYIKPTWNWHYTINGINWLLEHHFDFMGLIPKGLAIEVTEENNPYKN